MYWENPSILLGLWILPFLAWLLVHAQRRQAAAARSFVDPPMAARLMPPLGGPRKWIKGVLLLAGTGLLIVAAARPRFGVYTETVTQRGVDLFVLLDVSRSMTAEDVAPNRLERAKSDVRDLLPHLAGDRVGLIVFAGKPVVKAPLTTDQGFFRTVLDEVDVGSAPVGGTLIGDAIRKALEAMPRSRDRDQVLVLITDGEDQDSYAEDAAKEAAARGVRIFTVGLGDSHEGARIPVRDDAGRLTYLQYEGQERWSKRNDQLLRQIALTTDGAYVPAGTQAYDLGQVYADHLAGLTRSEYQSEKRKRYRERFQWFLGAGILLLLLEMGIAPYAPLAPRKGKSAAGRDRENKSRKSYRFRKSPSSSVALFAAFLLLPSLAAAAPGEAAGKVREGISSYKAGDYKQAAEAFGTADSAQPNDLRIAFDRGTALAAQGDDKAVELLQKAALSSDLRLAVAARYNLGCLAAAKARKRFGAHPETASPEVRKQGLADLVVAIGHFRGCLQIDKDHADARYNLELLRVWMKYMDSLWEQADRQKQRDELDLPAYLQMLEEKQRGLRLATQTLAETSDSPRLREARRAAEAAQGKLGEEIRPLKEKIEATLSKAAASPPGGPAAGNPPAPSVSAEQLRQAVATLQSMADEAATAIEAAANELHAGKAAAAVKPQTDVVEKFNQMYRTVAPFANLLSRAVATQQELVEANKPAGSTGFSRNPGEAPPTMSTRCPGGTTSARRQASPSSPPSHPTEPPKGGTTSARRQASPSSPQSHPAEPPKGGTTSASPSAAGPLPVGEVCKESAWNQEFVTRYSEILTPLAKQTLQHLESTPPLPATPPSSKPGSPAASADAEKLQKQRDGLKRSLEKAVELAPQVEKLSGEAVQLLRDRQPVRALPKQQEALKLLKEIAELLPKQDQKQDENKQNQNQQDKKQDKKQDKSGQKQQSQRGQDQQKQDERQAAEQQAEAQVRQIEEREKKREEMEKQVQRLLLKPGSVDKDW